MLHAADFASQISDVSRVSDVSKVPDVSPVSDTFDVSERALASEDLLFLTHHLLVRPTGWTGEMPIEILLHRNPLLGESVFRFWQREFLSLLRGIADAPTRSEQRRRVIAPMLDEIEWRAVHCAAAGVAAEDDARVLAALLAGVKHFDPVASPSRRYAVDTRRRLSFLSMQAFEFLAFEVFGSDESMSVMIEAFRRAARRRGDTLVARAVSPSKPQDAALRLAEEELCALRRALLLDVTGHPTPPFRLPFDDPGVGLAAARIA